MDEELRIIISGGGTGGHIFPAVSIANAIKAKRPDAKILFVGALGRMEMQRVPAAGYEIKGLPIQGFDRKNLLKNFKVLYKIWKSQRMAKKIIRDFRPMAAVGVGGYASGPTLNKAAAMGIPCLIQEQNSYAGVTNMDEVNADLGVASCWVHRAKEEFESEEGKALLRELGIEGDYVGVDHLVLGYAAKQGAPAPQRKPDYVRWVE